MSSYTPEGRTRYLWVPAIANPAVPKATELTHASAVDLVGGDALETITGFQSAVQTADKGSLGSSYTPKRPSTRSANDIEATWFDDDSATSDAAAIFDALAQYDRGNLVVIEPVDGVAQDIEATAIVSVYPAEVARAPERTDPVRGELRKFSATFTPSTEGSVNVAVVDGTP